MKNFVFFFALIMGGNLFTLQAQEPVSWTFTSKKTDDKTYEIRLNAVLNGDWHIYSQSTPDGGPIPTTVSFAKNPILTLDGGVKEVGKVESHFEPLFGVDVKQFSGKVAFVQTVKLKVTVKTKISGSISYMVCNDQECMPPTKQSFSIALN